MTGATAPAENKAHPQALMQMLTGFWMTQTLYAAVKLGVAEQLEAGPRTVEELARDLNADPGHLYRVLRALASVGIFQETGTGSFAQTPLSELLRGAHPESMRPVVLMLAETCYPVWGQLHQGVQSGKTPFALTHGMQAYEYFGQHPEAAEIFNAAMAALNRRDLSAVAEAYDFGQFQTVVDVGGGNGMLLATILKCYPQVSGIVFELPQVVGEAERFLADTGLTDRCRVIGGNFFESVAAGGDAYILSHIMHTFEDAQCVAILRNVHHAMPPDGRLLLVEDVLQPGNDPATAKTKFMDVNMLVLTPGGREHTREEFENLLSQAGFDLTRVIPTTTGTAVIEGVKRG